MASNMIIHAGGRYISMEELATIPAPAPTRTWNPIKHSTVLDTTCELLNDADFRINRMSAAVAKNDHRFFAVLDLKSEIFPGVNLSVGIRSSTDKSFPLGFIAGNRVFVCDNLSFHGELRVTRKHTINGMPRWQEDIASNVRFLGDFIHAERQRIVTMNRIAFDDKAADHVVVEALRQGLIGSPLVLPIATQWRQPTHPEFQPRTAWSLHNAFTECLKVTQARDLNRFANVTSKLYPMLMDAAAN